MFTAVEGPRGLPAISVAHYYELNCDLMRDPEMVFELEGSLWCPVSYCKDDLGVYQEAVIVDYDGQVRINHKLSADLSSFARQWDKNIAEQGFLKAANLPVS